MRSVKLPFIRTNNYPNENQQDESESKRNQKKFIFKKCLVSTKVQQTHSRHPFFYQLIYFSKLENMDLPDELIRKLYYIKFLSLREGFNFSEFLQICLQFNTNLFNDLQLINLKDSTSFFLEGLENDLKDINDNTVPLTSLNKYEELIKTVTLTSQEIHESIKKILFLKHEPRVQALNSDKLSFMSNLESQNRQYKNTVSKIKYKLPYFKPKGFLSCPKNLKSKILEFLQNNASKPYPSTILALSYFYGIEDSIKQSNQLGQQLLKNAQSYQYFDLAQSISVGLEYDNALYAEFIFFILNCAEGNNDDQTQNDDLPLIFDIGLTSNLNINFISRFDADDNQFEYLKQFLNKKTCSNEKKNETNNIKVEQLISLINLFFNLLQQKSENHLDQQQSNSSSQSISIQQNLIQSQKNLNLKESINSNQNLSDIVKNLENSIIKKDNIYLAFAIEMLKKLDADFSLNLDQNKVIELLCFAADNNHIKAFSKLSNILYNQQYELDKVTKSKLFLYLQQGCQLLIPSCMKIQIKLKIMDNSQNRDYKGAYQLMKELFFLGSDCFRFDLVRLAKFYKDFEFLSQYTEYLKNVGEKNIDILQALLLEKGYGKQQNLKQAKQIYKSLIQIQKKESTNKFDFSLNYLLAKYYIAKHKNMKAEALFKNIVTYLQDHIQNLDIISLYKVGKMYEKGYGFQQNLKKAEEIYLQIINNEKQKLRLNLNEQINSSPTTIKNIQRIDHKKLSQLSNKSLYSQAQDSDGLSEFNNFNFENKQPNVQQNSICAMNSFRKQEKMWEVIMKNLIVKKRLDNLKYKKQNMFEDNDGILDLDEFENTNESFKTYYFSSYQIFKSQQSILRKCDLNKIK